MKLMKTNWFNKNPTETQDHAFNQLIMFGLNNNKIVKSYKIIIDLFNRTTCFK